MKRCGKSTLNVWVHINEEIYKNILNYKNLALTKRLQEVRLFRQYSVTTKYLPLICYNIISVILSTRCVLVPPVFGDIFIKRGLTLTSALYLPRRHNEVLEQSVSLSVRNFWQLETFTHTSFSSPASFTSITDRIVSIWGGCWKRKEGCKLLSL